MKKYAYILIIFACIACVIACAACKAVRSYTTTATAISRGDTATIITTETIEAYEGLKR